MKKSLVVIVMIALFSGSAFASTCGSKWSGNLISDNSSSGSGASGSTKTAR